MSVWNSWFRLALVDVVELDEAASVARVCNRSRICEMLLMPPSMIWSCAVLLLPLATPWVIWAIWSRSVLATARPAASSAEELIR